mmetsp:Transcript_96111/g.267039  ORF Transcript_96111/g.267039 Transcript_96111/m.267039 type:complete len:455 (+) Transcript_96111:382-1746(+)
MEGHTPNCTVVILQRLVRLGGKVQVEPNHAPVVRPCHDVVPTGVHGDGRNPLCTAHQQLQRLLLLQVVDAHVPFCGHEEVRLRGVEGASLHLPSLQLDKGPHRLLHLQRVDDAGVRLGPGLGTHRCTIVALDMPRQLLRVAIGGEEEPAASPEERGVRRHGLPPHCTRLGALSLLLPLLLLDLGLSQLQQRLHRRLGLLPRLRFRPACCPLCRSVGARILGRQAGVYEVDGLIGCHNEQQVDGVPRNSSRHTVKFDAVVGATSCHLPDPQRLVPGDSGKPLARGVHGHATHHEAVPLVAHSYVRGEGPQILGAGQLWQQAFGIHVHPLLQCARDQVEVQAPFEALCDELLESWHLSQGVVLLRQVAESSVLLVLVLPGLLFVLVEEVLARWVVRLRVSRQRQLRRRKVGRGPAPLLGRIVRPEVPDLRLRRWRGSDLALSQQGHQFLDPHALPL